MTSGEGARTSMIPGEGAWYSIAGPLAGPFAQGGPVFYDAEFVTIIPRPLERSKSCHVHQR